VSFIILLARFHGSGRYASTELADDLDEGLRYRLAPALKASRAISGMFAP